VHQIDSVYDAQPDESMMGRPPVPLALGVRWAADVTVRTDVEDDIHADHAWCARISDAHARFTASSSPRHPPALTRLRTINSRANSRVEKGKGADARGR
jgi:hypothetical protein